MLRALLSDASRNWTLSEILEVTEWSDQVHVAGAGQARTRLDLSKSVNPRLALWGLAGKVKKPLQMAC